MNWLKLSNPIVIALLRSPLHRLFDAHTMLLTLTGSTSGKRYTFPVSYIDDGETLFVISQRNRTWWKNLRSGARVIVLLRGYAWQARGESFTDTETVVHDLLEIMQRIPAYQRLFHIKLDATGQPESPQDLTRLVQDRVIVRIRELTKLAA
jgi:hypothetical protein